MVIETVYYQRLEATIIDGINWFWKNIQRDSKEKEYWFQQMVVEHIHMQKINPRLNLILYTKIKTKCIIDLNVKQKTIKHLE